MQKTQETRVRSLGWEDPLEEGTATHSSILAWRIPRTEEPDGLQSRGSKRVNPLQYSRLENPTDRGVWRAAVHGVEESQTGLERLSTQQW